MSGDLDVDDFVSRADTAGWEMSEEKDRLEKPIEAAWQCEEEGSVWTHPQRYPSRILPT